MDGWDLIDEWWRIYNPAPANPEDVESGKRAPLSSTGYIKYPGGVVQPVTKGNRQTGACQYWINGLAPVCKNWNSATLQCQVTEEPKPSGYGIGLCDMLGRREWCTHYEKSKDYDPDEFACVLPCVERSGKGRQLVGENTMSFQPIFPEEIQGYNEKEGVGTCDGLGMGRGDQGPFTNVEQAWEKPVICRFFRPQLMGFGAYQPRPYHGDEVPGKPFHYSRNWIPATTAELHDGSAADPLTYMNPRLPFAFQVYNSRAMFQKCAHWESNRPAFFVIGSWGDNPHDFTIDLDEDPAGLCGCDDSACNPYRHVIEDWDQNLPPMLQYVWAKYGGVVCNGAKPECPCYSGDWLFCTDANMKDGMRISAEQIMELRFWASNWESKAEYDEFYAKKPGPTQDGYADETTSAIYTFSKWKMIDNNDPNKSIMQGMKVDLCQPAPLHMREFIPEEFLIRETIEYPTMEGYTGTNILGQGVLFPTLLRELDPPPDYVPDLMIIYPYHSKEPWNKPACGEDEDITTCVHDFNLMNSKPNISVVGYGPKESEVYVFNANIAESIGGMRGYVDRYTRASKIPASKWSLFIDACENAIEATEKQGKGMSKGITTLAGFFHLDNVELELNKVNYLYVICRYSDYLSAGSSEGFTFRKVTVESRYWGALITQSSAVHTPASSAQPNPFPVNYDPTITMTGEVHTVRGEIHSVIPAYFLFVYSIIEDHKAYYSYCIKRVTETVSNVEKWAQVGPTGYIWAEIDNIDINYLLGFGIKEATLTYSVPKDSSGNRRVVSMCGADPDDSIKLQVVYPSGQRIYLSGSGENQYDIDRRTIPPNAVLLKAPNPLPFFNSKWNLSIEYYYDVFSTSPGDNVVWPVGFNGGYFGQNFFANSPFQVQHSFGNNTFTVPSVGSISKRATVKVVAFIVDENGRTQVAAATKLVSQGQSIRCRNVDIFYRYKADATAYDLKPDVGFFTWTGSPSVDESTSKGKLHARTAMCGDHLCGGVCPPGYSWFPFNACSHPDFYNELNGAAQCTMRITEGDAAIKAMGPGAVRYGVANEYEAYVTPGGNWASACGTSFFYHYSQAPFSNMQFAGSGYKRAKVDKWYYIFRDWALPPFGNTGRGSVERYLTRDFSSHIDRSGPRARTAFRYMPMIVDIEDIVNQSLNAFEIPDNYSLARDPFSCFPMMSNFTANFLGEKIGETRMRWDEIVQVIYHGNCMYPWPLLEFMGVQRYGFLNEGHVWLWPEYWKPIERNLSSSHGEFKFIDLSPQEYYFDYVKEEHRFVTAEGRHRLIFEPPTTAEEDGEGEGDTKYKAYPSISLDGAYPRFFQIIYEDYDATTVDWKDESATGEEGSSGGDGEESGSQIYEKTCVNELQGIFFQGAPDGADPVWIHDFNTIFDGSASPDPDEDKKAFVGYDQYEGRIYAYYNRGLIARIPKNRLYYLPMAESNIGEGNGIYKNPDTTAEIRTFSVGSFGMAPIKIVVIGDWGVDKSGGEGKEIVYSKAGISVRESEEDVEFDQEGNPVWSNGEFVDSTAPGYGSTKDSISRYTAELNLPRRPSRFARNLNHFMVSITPYGSEKLKINDVYAVMGHYTRAEEEIMVWERMFYAGIAENFDSESINADGPNTKTYRDYDRDNENAGQYFPFNENLHSQDPALDAAGKIVSKLNMVGITEVFTEDEKLEMSMDGLHDIEREIQAELYEEAYELDDYDEINYSGVKPVAIAEFLKSINSNINGASSLLLSHYKTDWEHHPAKLALKQTGFWQPGGHYFKWSDSSFKTRCYVFGPVQEVFSTLFVHHKHGGASATLDAGHSYAGWGRLWYYEGKLANMRSTGQTQEYASTDALTGAKNAVFQESR